MAEITTPLTSDMKKQAKEALKGQYEKPGYGNYSPRELRHLTLRWTNDPAATFTRAAMEAAGWWIPIPTDNPKNAEGHVLFKAANLAKVDVS